MPVLIDEVIVEVQDGVTEAAEHQPVAQQTPMSPAELELTQMLELIRQRQERLRVD